METDTVLTIMAALLGAGGLWKTFELFLTRKVTAAKADVTATGAWKELLKPYQDSVAEMRVENASLRDRMARTEERLETALDQIGIVERENRAWNRYHVDVAAYIEAVSERLRNANLPVPEPPEPPGPRQERTRRSDHPH